MSTEYTNNQRIARNTVLLYGRMLFTMLVALYTSRVVLNALGVEDYGIYNVVGGVVAMFSFLSSSFTVSSSRFMTFSLGKGDLDNLKRVFSTSIIVQTSLAIIIVLLIEIVGIWFLNNKLQIPLNRLAAANWVMHCSILVFAVNLITVPFSASVIAHEKMGAYAFVSIFDSIIKLLIAYYISISTRDRLIQYAVLLLFASIVSLLIYIIYSRLKFEECKFHFVIDRPLLKQMTGFAGWTMLGNGASILNTQGVNILINMFFGVTLNAARGVATQVESAVASFVNSFMTALNPQITKSYAEGNLTYMRSLVCRGAKFSYFLMLFFAVPICLETEQILTLWLKIIPDYAVSFVRLTFVTSMCTVIGNTLVTAQYATGKIKKYQIVISICGLWVFPLTWIAFKLGCSPIWAYVIYAAIYFILIFVRIYLVKDMIELSWRKYIKDVIINCLLVTIVSIAIPLVIVLFQESSIIRLIEVLIVGILSTVFSAYTIGLEKNEKDYINNLIKKVCSGNLNLKKH